MIGGNAPIPSIGAELCNKSADVGERLARRHPHALKRGRMSDPDAELETAARDLVQIGGIVGKFLGGRGVDWSNRGGERDTLGGEG